MTLTRKYRGGYQPPLVAGTPIAPPRRDGNTDKALLYAAVTIVKHCKSKKGTCTRCVYQGSDNMCNFRICPEEWRIDENTK